MSSAIAETFYQEVIDDLENNRLILPTLPEVALKIRDAVEDDNASLDAIAKILASDAALSARIIRVANSPLMRANRQIESLDAAVSRLGMKLVRDMATSMVMEQMFQATSDITDRKLREIWEHSTQVAAISHALAKQFTKLKPEQAMLAGLVHEIGMLPILTKAEENDELLENEPLLNQLLMELHPKVGEAILKEWGFPAELVAVAAEHENLARDSASTDYVDVIIVANLQSHLGSQHPLAQQDWNNIPAFNKLGLTAEVNVVEMDETADAIREAKELLTS